MGELGKLCETSPLMSPPRIHVVGAGLAGLAAALRMSDAGANVVLHEAAGQAGGRCRSYHDSALGIEIDNGNHLVLSGNHSTMAYLARIGAADRLAGPAEPEFPFVDLAGKERWLLKPNPGRMPWWIFAKTRRVPRTRAADYLAIARLLWAGADATVEAALDRTSVLYRRLWRPLLLAALNTDPAEGSARLAAQIVRETLIAGGQNSRPLVAAGGLSEAFVAPALAALQKRGANIRFGARLRAIAFGETNRAAALDFGGEILELAPGDGLVLAVPAWIASALVPGIPAPTEFRAIVNAHFRFSPPPEHLPPITGVVGATAEWIFRFPDRLAVTISGADRLLEVEREELAQTIWREVAEVAGISAPLPPWQIIKERRATFAATPEQNAQRPGAATGWHNLALAGDWTATGLPATIEGAIRSGNKAADVVLRGVRS
jgi:squalene-associated FAD-dependent desaturase